jgi:hypothetical protein
VVKKKCIHAFNKVVFPDNNDSAWLVCQDCGAIIAKAGW